jgi:hypothetical protein
VLAYRAIAIWLPAPIGLVALGKLRGTLAAWGREDEAAAPVEAPALSLPGEDVVPAVPVRPAPSLPGATRPAWRPREAPCHAAA